MRADGASPAQSLRPPKSTRRMPSDIYYSINSKSAKMTCRYFQGGLTLVLKQHEKWSVKNINDIFKNIWVIINVPQILQQRIPIIISTGIPTKQWLPIQFQGSKKNIKGEKQTENSLWRKPPETFLSQTHRKITQKEWKPFSIQLWRKKCFPTHRPRAQRPLKW